MPAPYRTALLAHLQAEFSRLADPALKERTREVLGAYDQAAALGDQPSEWLEWAARELQEELAATSAQRARLIAELDRWIAFRSDCRGQN